MISECLLSHRLPKNQRYHWTGQNPSSKCRNFRKLLNCNRSHARKIYKSKIAARAAPVSVHRILRRNRFYQGLYARNWHSSTRYSRNNSSFFYRFESPERVSTHAVALFLTVL